MASSSSLPIRTHDASATSGRPSWSKVALKLQVRRNPEPGMNDGASNVEFIPLTLLLRDEARWLRSDQILPGHFSWDKLVAEVLGVCGISLDAESCELGYVIPARHPPPPPRFFKITSQRTFENALGTLYNAIYWTEQSTREMTLYLSNPRPRVPILGDRRSSDETLTSSPRHARPVSKTIDTAPDSHASKETANGPADEGDELDADALARAAANERIEAPNRADYDTEDEDGWNEANADYLEQLRDHELQRFINQADSTNCMRFNEKIWGEVCDFFGHDRSKTDPEYSVEVPGGFLRKLLPVQAHAVWHTLRECHGVAGSVFLAHAPGIGKTTIAFAIHWTQHIFNCLWMDISTDRNRGTGLHLQGDGEGECPSAAHIFRRYGFACPCSQSSPTSWLRPKAGVSVALVPAYLLRVWKAEHKQCFPAPDTPGCPANLRQWEYVAHADSPDTSRSQEAISRMRARIVPPAHPAEGVRNPPSTDPTLQNSQVFVLTTAESTKTQLIPFFTDEKDDWEEQPDREVFSRQGGKRTPIMVRQPPQRRRISWPTISVAWIYRDEFHERKEPCIGAIQALQTWLRSTSQSFVFMSGTPLQMGPSDIQQELKVMQRKRWLAHDVLRDWVSTPGSMEDERRSGQEESGKMESLVAQWNRALNVNASNTRNTRQRDAERVIADVGSLVETLMIRWTTSSRLLGKLVVKVPKNIYTEVACVHSDDWTQKVNDLQAIEQAAFETRQRKNQARYQREHGTLEGYKALEARKDVNVYCKSRLCASFPYLATIKDANEKNMRMTDGEWFDKVKKSVGERELHDVETGDTITELYETAEWVAGTETDPYLRKLKSITTSSSKLVAIQKTIDEFKDRFDNTNQLARQVYTSYFFTGAYIIYLWMIRILKIPEEEVVFLHKRLNKREFDRRFDQFRGNPDLSTPLEEQKTARYLVATSGSISTAVTLAQASLIAFLEPDYKSSTHEQTFCRHCRQGNKNPCVHSLLLVAKGNAVEEKIMEINAVRKCIIKAAEKKISE